MAGAGAKLFTSGSVLTADQVNTYLMDQAIMKFASTTARDAAFGGAGEPVLAEGMFAYTTDTNTLWFYDGSGWEVATIKPSEDYSAGKNKFINGDFTINQRGFSSTTSSGDYVADRWIGSFSGGTVTSSRQAFTLGAAPVAGYEASTFARMAVTGQSAAGNNAQWRHNIEDVRTFAGRTVTLSFWAKADSGTPSIAANFAQFFGSGGSPSSAAFATTAQKLTISTSWARYSMTFAIASIAGKTIGTDANSSYLQSRIFVSAGTTFNTETDTIGIQNNTFDIWGVQVESGSVASAFQTSTGSIQGELAACQRYYQRISNDATNSYTGLLGSAYSATGLQVVVNLKTSMRVKPTSVDFSTIRVFDGVNAATSITAVTLSAGSTDGFGLDMTASSMTQFRTYFIIGGASTAGYLGFGAEL